MIITNEEKQTLQRRYAERIKNLAAHLKQAIDQDDQKTLEQYIERLQGSSKRIVEIQSDWYDDQSLELQEKMTNKELEGEENEV